MQDNGRPSTAVTGANGFVGSHVLAHLRAAGHAAVGMVRRTSASAQSGEHAIAEWSASELERVFTGASAIVHAASVVHRPGASAAEYEDFNVRGTETLLRAARAAGVRSIVFLSSIKVYGENVVGEIDETTALDLSSPYSASKVAAERLLVEAAAAAGGPTATILRLSPVFGIGDKGNVRRVALALARRRFVIPGDGSTRKSLVHVDTVARAVARVLERPTTATYVLADPSAPSIRELAAALARSLGVRKPVAIPISLVLGAAGLLELYGKVRGREPLASRELIRKSLRSTVCSSAKFEADYGMSCHVDLQAALDEEVRWLRSARLV